MHRCKHIPQPLKADPQAKAVVRASTSPTREKLFFKISFPSKNFKNANTRHDRKAFGQLTSNLNIDKGCKTRTKKRQGITLCISNSGFSTKSELGAFNKLSGSGQVIALKSATAHTLGRWQQAKK